MARSFLADYLQSHAFWLLDASELTAGGFPVLDPTAGFSGITAPETTLTTKDITEGTGTVRHVVVGESVGNIVLQRGVLATNQDMYYWARAAALGTTRVGTRVVGALTPRRDLILVHHMSRGLNTLGALRATTQDPVVRTVTEGLVAALAPAPYETLGRLPARAWYLRGCLPVRYKAGTDFDASNAAISVAELEVSVEEVDEYGLGG